jgi:spore coat protein U-like protein
MRMTRFLLAVCCALVHLSASAQFPRPRAKPPAGGNCGNSQGAVCQINSQAFNFGRSPMTPATPAINGNNTISVTCIRGQDLSGADVQVDFHLRALPAEPNRFMRDRGLFYLRYFLFVDAARTRPWGDGVGATFTFDGTLNLNDRNPVGTLVFPIYGQVPGGQIETPPGQWLGAVVTNLEYQVSCN